jgi:exo-beta-1,3-glucanase (GH17 family)/cellulose synthase/poly-beta-1,6-N-acetylglucosamine synthase-like glycosyltransferase
LLVALANIAGWWLAHPERPMPVHEGAIGGLAYNAYQRWDSPLERRYPDAAAIAADMALLSKYTRRLRTYGSVELPALPAIAQAYGLKLTLGAWLDTRLDNNRREIDALVADARRYRNVERVMVGNESVLHGLLTVEALGAYLDEVRQKVPVPVSTAEPWHVWLRNPELARHVDYITVHLLPYWEGVPHEKAVDYAVMRLEQIRERFPGKRVVIGEIGWPSQGDRREGANAGRLEQAEFIREFLARAQGRNWDYYLMEAIDQPWKQSTEGRVGAYWGLLDAERELKFELARPVASDPYWPVKALLAALVAVVPILLLVRRLPDWRWPSRLFMAGLIQGGAALLVWMIAIPFELYLGPLDWLGLVVLVPSITFMVLLVLVHGLEFSELFWSGNLRRLHGAAPMPATPPRVSVHLACCNEPPEMVIATIDSLCALDYPDFEILVVDNNTRDPARWQPVHAHVAGLRDSRVRFFHLPNWPGYKAGALNFALEQTDPGAQLIAVVDADYLVERNWLRDLVGHFADPSVAVVQAPQAHREWQGSRWRRMMNFEYDGFFRIGMHHRNERDAIIQHGTMTLIRARALREHGRWSTWCICEDAELGLRLMQAGWTTRYVDHVYGTGLTPDGFPAFRRQRRRWALGGMQILRAHASALFRGRPPEGEPGLSGGQRFHFVAGWMGWLGDAAHLIFTFAAMFWTIGIVAAQHWFSLPIMLYLVPVLLLFVGKVLLGPLLYLRRVPGSISDVLGAALAGMALSHGIAVGVLAGLSGRRAVFEVTTRTGHSAGAGSRLHAALADTREEAGMLLALVCCIGAMAMTRLDGHVESALWMTVLAVQALPYLAAVVCAWIARGPLAQVSAEPAPARRRISLRRWRPAPAP